MKHNRYAVEDEPYGDHGRAYTAQQIAAELDEAEALEGHPVPNPEAQELDL